MDDEVLGFVELPRTVSLTLNARSEWRRTAKMPAYISSHYQRLIYRRVNIIDQAVKLEALLMEAAILLEIDQNFIGLHRKLRVCSR